jgi:putative hydrolase of the HAD superfamily
MGIHDYFDWFLCCRDVGMEKPEVGIYEEAHRRAQLHLPGVLKEEMLHIGDNFTTDFCGARAAGMQALFLGKMMYC